MSNLTNFGRGGTVLGSPNSTTPQVQPYTVDPKNGGANVRLEQSTEDKVRQAEEVMEKLAFIMSYQPCWKHTVGRCCTGKDPFDNNSRSLSVFVGFEYFYNWFRFALWVNMFVQTQIQDAYISPQQLCIIFGVFCAFELLKLAVFQVIKYFLVSTSWLTAHLGRSLMESWLMLLIMLIALLNQFLAGRYKPGFLFEATTPTGTGISVNNAWASGTSIAAIPSNVWFNIQYAAFLIVFVVTYMPLIVFKVDFAIRHGQHHHRFAQY